MFTCALCLSCDNSGIKMPCGGCNREYCSNCWVKAITNELRESCIHCDEKRIFVKCDYCECICDSIDIKKVCIYCRRSLCSKCQFKENHGSFCTNDV